MIGRSSRYQLAVAVASVRLMTTRNQIPRFLGSAPSSVQSSVCFT
jgi:hypothetical protein